MLYGGSNLGLMGVVSGAALAKGGTVVGVIPTFFSEEIILSQPVTQLVRVSSLAERKAYLLSHSDAFIALPGGIGTLDEVTEVMVANQIQQLNKPMLLLNLDGYYDPFLLQLERFKADGLMRSNGGLTIAPTPQACLENLCNLNNRNDQNTQIALNTPIAQNTPSPR